MTQRSFTRVPVHIKASLRVAGHEPLEGRVRDLSLNGIGIDTDASAQPGALCTIRLLLGTGGEPIPVDVTGVVVRSSGGLVAARILGIDPDDYEHFSKLVLYNAPDAGAFEEELTHHADEQPAIRPLGVGRQET